VLLGAVLLAVSCAVSSTRASADASVRAPDGGEVGALTPFELDERSYAAWRAYLRLAPEETAWLEIPWRTSFADGLRDAATEGKPLLFWGMNGHPLGAT